MHCLPVTAREGFQKKHVLNYNILYLIRLRTLDDEVFFKGALWGNDFSLRRKSWKITSGASWTWEDVNPRWWVPPPLNDKSAPSGFIDLLVQSLLLIAASNYSGPPQRFDSQEVSTQPTEPITWSGFTWRGQMAELVLITLGEGV